MLYSIFSMRPWELVQSNTSLHTVKQAFSGISSSESIAAFFRTPEFRLFTAAIVGVTLLILAIHAWAWVKMLLEKEETTPLYNKRIHTPPSQNYVPETHLWRSSRVGFVPEFGLIDHKPEAPEPVRGESIPLRGGDLPPKPAV
jgi:hypothetical protein